VHATPNATLHKPTPALVILLIANDRQTKSRDDRQHQGMKAPQQKTGQSLQPAGVIVEN
jgi:hypothetical protein